MKIDESCINHNVVRIINDLLGDIYDIPDNEANRQTYLVMTLGEIHGAVSLANALKEVLKA